MKLQILKITGIWILILFLILPFNYYVIPSIGASVHWGFLSITQLISSVFTDIKIIEDPTISDSISSYILGALSLPLAALIYFFFKRILSREIHLGFILSIILTIISFFLLRYGLDKVLDNQFYEPEPNILNTKVGNLDKDILFWTSMGTSKVYNLFMGLIEVIAGVFILIPRTRKISTLAAIVIFANVLFINIGFDISVKYLSALLLFTSCWIYLNLKEPSPSISKSQWISQFSLTGLFLIELTVSTFSVAQSPVRKSTGTYSITTSSVTNLPIHTQLHFHSKGYLISEKGDSFESRKITEHTNSFDIEIEGTRMNGQFNKNILLLTNDRDTVIARKSEKNYPLLQDDFHLTSESYSD